MRRAAVVAWNSRRRRGGGGRLELGRLAITTIYPMGFFRSWRYEPAGCDALVYPAPEGVLPLPSGVAFTAEAVAGTGAGGDDYTGVRPYQTGESQRARGLARCGAGAAVTRQAVRRLRGAGASGLNMRMWPGSRAWRPGCHSSAAGSWKRESQGVCLRSAAAWVRGGAGARRSPIRRRCLGALALFDEPGAPAASTTRGFFHRRRTT